MRRQTITLVLAAIILGAFSAEAAYHWTRLPVRGVPTGVMPVIHCNVDWGLRTLTFYGNDKTPQATLEYVLNSGWERRPLRFKQSGGKEGDTWILNGLPEGDVEFNPSNDSATLCKVAFSSLQIWARIKTP